MRIAFFSASVLLGATFVVSGFLACGGDDSGVSTLFDAGSASDVETRVDATTPRDSGIVDSGFFDDGGCHTIDGGFAPDASIADGGFFTFATELWTVSGTISGSAIGDVTGDHLSDVVIAVRDVASGPSVLLVFRQNSCGGLEPPRSYNGDYQSLTIADVTGDGRNDVVTGSDTNLDVIPQKSDGTLGAVMSYPTNASGSFTVGDFNHDGLNDVYVSRTSLGQLFLQNSSGVLTGGTLVMSNPTDTMGTVEGDFDHDGRDDIAFAATSGIYVLHQQVAGGFGSATLYGADAGEFPTHATAADFTGDGLDDVATSYFSSTDIAVYPQSGGALLTPTTFYAGTTIATDQMSTIDVNTDGLADLLQLGGGNIQLRLQNDAGALDSQSSFAFGGAIAIASGDLNNDGKPDLIGVTKSAGIVNTLVVAYNAR